MRCSNDETKNSCKNAKLTITEPPTHRRRLGSFECTFEFNNITNEYYCDGIPVFTLAPTVSPTLVPTMTTSSPVILTSDPTYSPTIISLSPTYLPTKTPITTSSIVTTNSPIKTTQTQETSTNIPTISPTISPTNNDAFVDNHNVSQYIPWIITGFVGICCMLTCITFVFFCVYIRSQTTLKTHVSDASVVSTTQISGSQYDNNSHDHIDLPQIHNYQGSTDNINIVYINDTNHNENIDKFPTIVDDLALPMSTSMRVATPKHNKIIEPSKSVEMLYDPNMAISPNTNAGDDDNNYKYGELSPAMSTISNRIKHEGIIQKITSDNFMHNNNVLLVYKEDESDKDVDIATPENTKQ